MLKPVQEGSSLGVSKCKTAEQLESCLEAGSAEFGKMFAERFVTGTEITVGVIERDGRPEALPILQLVPKNEFYDYEAKYTEGMTEFILPARLEPGVYARAQQAAIAVFGAIGCRGYSRVDMMVDERRYLLVRGSEHAAGHDRAVRPARAGPGGRHLLRGAGGDHPPHRRRLTPA